MRIIREIAQARDWSLEKRQAGLRVGLVPTMGYLHAGHLSLVAEALRRADRTIVSIFVNPTQFGANEDLATYPRDFERDCKLLQEAGTDVVFAPDDMYPAGFESHVEVEHATRGLCGELRPTHFRGVATIVTKLFHITWPHVAVFGEKDFQQLAVIRRMVRDLDFDIEVVGVPTVREDDGLAMSSRNAYLEPSQRRAAVCIPRALAAAESLWKKGERNGDLLAGAARRVIEQEPAAHIEYVTMADPVSLREVEAAEAPTLLAVAVRIGGARLIDNCILGRDPAPGTSKASAQPKEDPENVAPHATR